MHVNVMKPDPEQLAYAPVYTEPSITQGSSLPNSGTSTMGGTQAVKSVFGANSDAAVLNNQYPQSLHYRSGLSVLPGVGIALPQLFHPSTSNSATTSHTSMFPEHNDALETIRSHIQAYSTTMQPALLGPMSTSVQPGVMMDGFSGGVVQCIGVPAPNTNRFSSPPALCARTSSRPQELLPSTPIPMGPSGADIDTPTVCVICGDKASGRHYGVISCEGCKGFFKRTVRKQVEYVCRGSGDCPVDGRRRTRCQACRYERCLSKGMKREAVQEERHRYTRAKTAKGSKQPVIDSELDNSTSVSQTSITEHGISDESGFSASPALSHPAISVCSVAANDSMEPTAERPLPSATTITCLPELTLSGLLAAELSTDSELPTTEAGESVYVDIGEDNMDPLVVICQSVEEQLHRLLNWARQLPCFSLPYLSIDDQFWLLKSAWPELLLISAAFNSIVVNDGLLLASGRHLSRSTARLHGLGPLIDRFLAELVSRFRELGLERIELALLRAIILFNPDANNLVARNRVESIRESLYAGLHSYCTTSHSSDTSRFTKLLLRLPPLRSIAQKCLEHLVFVKLAAEDPTSRRLINLVEHGVWPAREQSFESSNEPVDGNNSLWPPPI